MNNFYYFIKDIFVVSFSSFLLWVLQIKDTVIKFGATALIHAKEPVVLLSIAFVLSVQKSKQWEAKWYLRILMKWSLTLWTTQKYLGDSQGPTVWKLLR